MNEHVLTRDLGGSHEEPSPRQQRIAARAQADAADAWRRWSDEINSRLAAIERRLVGWLGDGSEQSMSEAVITQVLGDLMSDFQKQLDARAGVEAIPALREEFTICDALLRDEVLGRLDSKQYGLATLLDFDPQRAERALATLQAETRKDHNSLVARLNEVIDRVAEVEKRRRDLKALGVKVAILERGLPKPTSPAITGWKIDPGTYRATPILADGSEGAVLELRGLFEAYHDETSA